MSMEIEEVNNLQTEEGGESLLDRIKTIMYHLKKTQGLDDELGESSQQVSDGNDLSSIDRLKDWVRKHSERINAPGSCCSDTTMSSCDEASPPPFSCSLSEQALSKPALKTAEVSLFPVLRNFFSEQKSFVIYGDLHLDFGFGTEIDTPMRRIIRPISHVEHFKSDGLLIFRNHQSSQTVRDLQPIIAKALSLGDKQYYELALALKAFSEILPDMIEANIQGTQWLTQNPQILEQYDLHYMKFEAWALQEVRKVSKNSIFTFQIKRFNPITLELETRISGQSQGMAALRGFDIQNPSELLLAMRDNYHYLDGDSNLRLLKHILHKVLNLDTTEDLQSRIITFDELKIDVTHTCQTVTNRSQNYPFVDEQIKLDNVHHEFSIGMATISIDEKVLADLVRIRKNRSALDTALLEDFTYSLESQMFLEKYYQEQPVKATKKRQTRCK